MMMMMMMMMMLQILSFSLLSFFLRFRFQVPGAVEYGISSDDLFSLKNSPGKTWVNFLYKKGKSKCNIQMDNKSPTRLVSDKHHPNRLD